MTIINKTTGSQSGTYSSTELISAIPTGTYGIFNIIISCKNIDDTKFIECKLLRNNTDLIYHGYVNSPTPIIIKGILLGSTDTLFVHVPINADSLGWAVSANGYTEDVNNPVI